MDPRVLEIEQIQAKSRDGEMATPVTKLNEEDDFSPSSSEEEKTYETQEVRQGQGSRKTINEVGKESETTEGEEDDEPRVPLPPKTKTKIQNKFALLLDEDDDDDD
jgi:hypothetical protein